LKNNNAIRLSFKTTFTLVLIISFAVGFAPTASGHQKFNAEDVNLEAQKTEKISTEELVAKHLASIGRAEDIKGIKSRVMVGEGALISKIGAAFTLKGTAQLASEGNRVLFAMLFDSEVYPYEKAAFDGKEQSLGFPSGKRTMLAEFLRSQNSILKDGLFMGTLSSAWTLANLESIPKAKLELVGVSKINERQCYKVKYSSSRTGSLKITLYFDVETFRHMRTEYQYTIEPGMGRSSTDVRSNSTIERYSLREDFSDFKVAGKLTLPFLYTINITNEGQIGSGTNSRDWTVKILQVYFDEALSVDVFKVS
jgi:hypothetical protein